MERLTLKNERLGFVDRNKLPSYEAVYGRLKSYEDLEEQGKLLKLPCSVGDTVYTLNTLLNGKTVIGETTADSFLCALCVVENRFGKTIFLKREEAEAELKEL